MKVSRRNRGAEILTFMSKHPGIPYTAADIQKELNFPEGADERLRIVSSMSYLMRQGHIESFVRGSYTFTKPQKAKEPEPVKTPVSTYPELLQFIGTFKDGTVLYKDDNDHLWTAKEM